MHKEIDRVFTNVSLTDLRNVAHEMLKSLKNQRIWLFFGEMGSGKTTFIKELCQALGVEDVVSSPTFSLVNEYLGNAGEKVFHFDFYRIKNESEAYEIGAEEYFYSGSYCFIEWPERIPSICNIPSVHVHILPQNQETRKIAVSVYGGEEKENRI